MTESSKKDVGEILVEYQPKLKSFIRKRVSNKEDADDILQDVLFQFLKADSMLNPIEQISAWLYRVAKNNIINKRLKKKEEELPYYSNYDGEDSILDDFSEILFSEDNSTPESEYLRSLVWKDLEEALSELPKEQKYVFEKMEMEGFSAKELSKETGIAVNTLISRKHYAVLHLRKRMKELYADIMAGNA